MIRRGDIYFVNLDPSKFPFENSGWGQRGSRGENEKFFVKIEEIKGFRGGVRRYSAQGNPQIDDEISEKGRFRTGTTKGREQKGRRPVLVVSVDAINAQPLVVTVVVGTAARNVPRDYPVNVRYPSIVTGLPEDTVFLCFQIRSLDPKRFLDQDGVARPAGFVPENHMAFTDKALRKVLGI